jgi:hypothetical protein
MIMQSFEGERYMDRELLTYRNLEGRFYMSEKLLRVGTTYISVTNVEQSSAWYVNKLDAELSYKDGDKAILNLAN